MWRWLEAERTKYRDGSWYFSGLCDHFTVGVLSSSLLKRLKLSYLPPVVEVPIRPALE